MTSINKIRLGNVIAALLTLVACFLLANSVTQLFLSLSEVASSVGIPKIVSALVLTYAIGIAIVVAFHFARQFVFNNALIRFFYQIPVPCRN